MYREIVSWVSYMSSRLTNVPIPLALRGSLKVPQREVITTPRHDVNVVHLALELDSPRRLERRSSPQPVKTEFMRFRICLRFLPALLITQCSVGRLIATASAVRYAMSGPAEAA